MTRFGIYEKKKIAVFDRYAPKLHGVFVLYGGTGDVFRLETNIEPYTGQDKPSLDRIKEMNSEPMRIVPVYPFTVILKSGVKIGISATMFDYINEQDNITTSVQTVEDGTFILSEIAAIVPTENIML